MRILQVALGVSPTAGGPVRSITGLTRALSNVSGCAVDFLFTTQMALSALILGIRVIRGHRVAGTVDRSDDFANELMPLCRMSSISTVFGAGHCISIKWRVGNEESPML